MSDRDYKILLDAKAASAALLRSGCGPRMRTAAILADEAIKRLLEELNSVESKDKELVAPPY
jgi:hypothetical protein